MKGGATRRSLVHLVFTALLAGCSEELTQPGQCPELCPGGTPQGQEEILTVLPNQDSTFSGYTARSAGSVMLVASGIPTTADTNFGVVRFGVRPDSILFRDTLRTYTIDSVALTLLVVAHDTMARNVRVGFYRLPSNLDTVSLAYPSVSASMVPANLIGSVPVSDMATADTIQLRLRGADLSKVALQPSDNKRLAIGIAVTGNSPTGARIGNGVSVGPPAFTTFVKPNSTPTQLDTLASGPEFAGYVSRQTPAIDPTLVTVGGVPSSRVLLRFPWPAKLRDSATIVRATLELVPAQPVAGLPNDAGTLNVRGLATDFGAKSPTEPASLGFLPLAANFNDTVRVEIGTVVQLWQGGLRPPAIFLSITPEVETFTRPVFGSSRSGAPPRIRVNFLPRFPFSSP